MNEQIISALTQRYAVQKFDPSKIMKREDLETILESGRLAPSSFGFEPWKFIVVEDKELRAQLRAASWDQSKVTDASYLVVIAHRTNTRSTLVPELITRTAKVQGVDEDKLSGLKQMVDGAVAMRDDASLDAWNTSQVYIPLGVMIATASMLGIDNAPMEGFDKAKVNEILGLDAQNLSATTMLALGYRAPDDGAAQRPKTRRAKEEVVSFVK